MSFDPALVASGGILFIAFRLLGTYTRHLVKVVAIEFYSILQIEKKKQTKLNYDSEYQLNFFIPNTQND